MRQPQVNQYEVLITTLLSSPDTDVVIEIFSTEHLAAIRAGLSRAKQSYERVQQFLSEPNLLKGKQFAFALVPGSDNKLKVTLVDKVPVVKFKILTEKLEEQHTPKVKFKEVKRVYD